MAEREGERLAALEEWRQGVREDLAAIVAEQQNMRRRLHDVEGICRVFLDSQKTARAAEAKQYRHLEIRIQVLTVVVGIAAILSPFLVAVLTGK